MLLIFWTMYKWDAILALVIRLLKLGLVKL